MQPQQGNASISPTTGNPALKGIYSRERSGSHCAGVWVVLGACQDETENPTSPGFDPRTGQPAASRYSDYGIHAAKKHNKVLYFYAEMPQK
jgi:hypothetical protein